MNRKINNRKKTLSGFTLVETLVAVSILSLSIAGAFTAVQAGLKSSITAKDQVTAFYLAQEGMEYIKNIRDENALNFINGGTNTWLTSLSAVSTDPCYFGKTCTIDSPAKTATSCSGGFGTCPFIYRNTTTGLMGHTSTSGWSATSFRREIQFQNTVPGQEAIVTIKISWTSGGKAKNFQISQSLFNRLQ